MPEHGWLVAEGRWSHGGVRSARVIRSYRRSPGTRIGNLTAGVQIRNIAGVQGMMGERSCSEGGSTPWYGSVSWVASAPPTVESLWTSARRSVRRCSRCSVLAAGSAVPVPRLVDLVWGEEPPRTAEKTLQSYVVRLRKGLGAGSIVRVGAAYRLSCRPGGDRRGALPAAAGPGQHRGGTGRMDRDSAGRARRAWPHPCGGRAGGAVAGHGGDRPRTPTPDQPVRSHWPTDRAHREPIPSAKVCGRC